ncbi:MAG TPA: hypothetical protein VGM58_00670, partial [Verrucomicrobiae bacterium]
AAAVARTALKQRQIVWWNANDAAAWYYGVSLGNLDVSAPPPFGAAAQLSNPQPALLEGLPKPDLIIASKPDLFDPNGQVERYIQTNHYKLEQTFIAFKIWKK